VRKAPNRKLPLAACLIAAVGVFTTWDSPQTAAQQAADSLVDNPTVFLPSARINEDVLSSLRRARAAELEAERLQRDGKEEEALERWRDAFGRYEHLRRDFLRPDLNRNQELLVRVDWADSAGSVRAEVFAETWQPLGDYLNSRLRTGSWPRLFRDRLAQRQHAPALELLELALRDDDEDALRRCARHYQFSTPGRKALKLLAQRALERGDAVVAVRWLEELQLAWPEHFERSPSLHVLYVRACRDAGMDYRLGRMLRQLERRGFSAEVDVAGRRYDSADLVKRIANEASPQSRRELQPGGWRTAQGSPDRNGIAPPVVNIGGMVPLIVDETPAGRTIGHNISTGEDPRTGRPQTEPSASPVIFPTVHESGIFVHRTDQASGADDKLYWFRHGRETNPLQLEVPATRRYKAGAERGQQGIIYWGPGVQSRDRYIVQGSTVGRLRYELDGRHADALFAVMGQGRPTSERPAEPTGNQIQGWNLSDDASLLMTLPNEQVEEADEFNGFLRHVVFRGAPLIRQNKLYIGGVITERNSHEVWLFCFDVTPKGDAARGGGKLLWRAHLGSRAFDQSRSSWGRMTNVAPPEVSSPAESGGMVFISSHAGFTAAVDSASGEVAWVSRYGRVLRQIQTGWFNNPPVVAAGLVVTAPYDHDLALVLDTVRGTMWMEYPVRRMGFTGEYEHVLGAVDGHLVIQGRTRLHCIALPSFRAGGVRHADYGELVYQSTEFASAPTGRGLIAGDRVLVPTEAGVAMYDARTGKLLTTARLQGLTPDSMPATLTVYSRGEAYEDEHGQLRHRPVTLTDPETGNVYNVDHLPNGATFTFPGTDRSAIVKKETFLIHATARWMHLFKVEDTE